MIRFNHFDNHDKNDNNNDDDNDNDFFLYFQKELNLINFPRFSFCFVIFSVR